MRRLDASDAQSRRSIALDTAFARLLPTGRRSGDGRRHLVVIALAAQQLLSRATDVVGPFSIADFSATAEAADRPAPNSDMRAVDGSASNSLDDYRGDVVVLNFWASWCGPCRVEASDLQATWDGYRGRGVQFLGVDYQDDIYAAHGFIDEFGITYPSVFDLPGRSENRWPPI